MHPKIQKTIDLMKRAYDQPIIFHRLHCHLSYLLDGLNPVCEITDSWSKILVLSASPNKIPNQGSENKVLNSLKKLRPPATNAGNKLKVWIFLYYLINRPPDLTNHIILFEMITNFLGHDSFTDSLILKALSNSLLPNIFGQSASKKLRDDSVAHLLKIIAFKDLSLLNKSRALPCFVNYPVKPPLLSNFDIQNDVFTLFFMESVCLYAKFTKYPQYIKEILPDSPIFVTTLSSFINRSFSIQAEEKAYCSIKESLVEDKEIFSQLEYAYNNAINKRQFIARVVDFVSNLG